MKQFHLNTYELEARALEGTPPGDKMAKIVRQLFSPEGRARMEHEAKLLQIKLEYCIAAGLHGIGSNDDLCVYCGNHIERPKDGH